LSSVNSRPHAADLLGGPKLAVTEESFRVETADGFLGVFGDFFVRSQQLDVLELHAPAGVVVGIIRREEKPLGAEKFDGFRSQDQVLDLTCVRANENALLTTVLLSGS